MQRYSLKKIAAALVGLLEQYPLPAAVEAVAAELARQRRQRDVAGLLQAVAAEWFRQRGELTATVTTARPVSAAMRKEISELLKRLTQAKRVQLTSQIDQALVGGWRAETSVVTIDASLQTKLNALTRRA